MISRHDGGVNSGQVSIAPSGENFALDAMLRCQQRLQQRLKTGAVCVCLVTYVCSMQHVAIWIELELEHLFSVTLHPIHSLQRHRRCKSYSQREKIPHPWPCTAATLMLG